MQNVQPWKGFIVAVCLLIMAGCSDSSTGSTDGLAKISTSNAQQATSAGFADVDGDGIKDMVVCAPYATRGETVGLAFVYPGSLNGFAAQPTLILSGGDNFGFSFASLGDVDGDARDDFAISALHGSGDDVSLSGSVTVFKGGSNGAVIRMLAGEAALDRFGYALASGDLNGDGASELIIGAPFHSPTPALFQQGAVYIYDFKTQSMTSIKAGPAVQGIGWTVAAGNVNGDSYGDLAMTAQSAYGVGNKVCIYSGHAGFMAGPGLPARTLMSMASGFGDSLGTVPDLNNDGYDEILVGASKATVGGMTETGSLFMVKGGIQAGTVNLDSTPSALLQRINGQSAYDRFGAPAIAIGDVDGNGRNDIAVSATHADSGPYLMSGKVYILKGEELAAGEARIDSAQTLDAPDKDMHFGKNLTRFNLNGHKLLVGSPTAASNSGALFGFNPADGKQLFQVSYGGITTANSDCCK